MSPVSPLVGKERQALVTTAYRVLIVDENQDCVDLLALWMQLKGHDIRTAQDGVSALAIAESFQPALVVLDINLPKLDGYAVAQQIRKQAWGQDSLLITLSGWGRAEDRQRSLAAGCNFHIVKPVDLDVLDALLAGWAGMSRGECPN